MREDMDKVIVERPRWGSRWIGSGEGRRYRASEDVPSKQGMRQGYRLRKDLNEDLNPLKRYIASQVNRPWIKVYGELCANIDRRNTVQAHIFTHIDSFVERHTRLIDGKVFVLGRYGGHKPEPLDQSSVELYVHPRTGILLRNRHRKSWSDKQRDKRGQEQAQIAARRRVLNGREQLHLIEGFWYWIELAALPAGVTRKTVQGSKRKIIAESEMRWDVVRKKVVGSSDGNDFGSGSAYHWYGMHGVYAKRKRQLSERELKKYGLKQKGRQTPGLFIAIEGPAPCHLSKRACNDFPSDGAI